MEPLSPVELREFRLERFPRAGRFFSCLNLCKPKKKKPGVYTDRGHKRIHLYPHLPRIPWFNGGIHGTLCGYSWTGSIHAWYHRDDAYISTGLACIHWRLNQCPLGRS